MSVAFFIIEQTHFRVSTFAATCDNSDFAGQVGDSRQLELMGGKALGWPAEVLADGVLDRWID